jgi:OCT family organic cation transporter-like MFS transporter 4/5
MQTFLNQGSINITLLLFQLKINRVLPESPRWLLSQDSIAEAEVEIRKMARMNKRILPPGYFNQFKVNFTVFKFFVILNVSYYSLKTQTEETGDDTDSNHSHPTYGALDLVKTPNMARKTAIITFIWYTFIAYYVLLLIGTCNISCIFKK